MRVLYIDTSSSYLYSAIVEDEKLIASVSEDYGQSLSAIALPKIVEMFNENKLSPKDVDKIIVVDGPGSFTGIRIGITIAKVYAWSLNIPITTITSLEAMSISSKEKKIHVPMINARRGYVYAAIYDENQKVIHKPEHMKWEDLEKEIHSLDSVEIISNDEFDWDVETVPYQPDFVKIVETFKEKEPMNPHAVNPEYLKLTEAEEKL
jgi:tRNA threonylcarbamoyladenosine biosynthesis protein TsaB